MCSGLLRAQLWALARGGEMLIAIHWLKWNKLSKTWSKVFWVCLFMMWILTVRKTSIFGWAEDILFLMEEVSVSLWNPRNGGCKILQKPVLATSVWMSQAGIEALDFLLNPLPFGETNEDTGLGGFWTWLEVPPLASGLVKFYLPSHVSWTWMWICWVRDPLPQCWMDLSIVLFFNIFRNGNWLSLIQ